jgi:hypothetical protein
MGGYLGMALTLPDCKSYLELECGAGIVQGLYGMATRL